MKRFLLLTAALFMVTLASAQGKFGADSAECIKYLSFYQQYVKQKDLKGAMPSWRNAIRLCPPTASQNMLLDGMKIMRMEINANKQNPIRKKELVDSLMMLHEMRIANYPKYEATAKTNKAMDMINFAETGKEQEVFNVIQDAMEAAQAKTSATLVVRYMNYAIELYKTGIFTNMDVFAAFEESMKILDMVLTESKTPDVVEKAMGDVENLFAQSGVADCDNLVAVFQPRYEAAPTDKALLSNIITLLTSTSCTDTDLFLNAVEGLHAIEATEHTAYLLYKLYSSYSNGVDNAVKYMIEAISLPGTDTEMDAQYSYELATYLFAKTDRKSEAVEFAKAAADLSATWAGKAYMLLGNIWVSTKCDGNPIETRAPYWVATDYFNKAKRADETLAADANAQISNISKYYPAQADAFMYDLVDGDSFKVSCGGLHETTTVKTQK